MVSQNRINITSRRYIGSKAKLIDWIMGIIDDNIPDVQSFTDLFAGTGAVANMAVNKFSEVIINDILLCNHIIYKAFFEKGTIDDDKIKNIINNYNDINPETLPNNYFSNNFGNKFFEYNVSKKIGYIRQDIENIRGKLTDKEYCVLVATLIYNIDKLANTVGHFDAYIRKDISSTPLYLHTINYHSIEGVHIYQEDANNLVKKIHSDVIYIDPPYNSRQYGAAYHLYENLVKWEKPSLKGVAMKMDTKHLRSQYCTEQATNSFADLIKNINAKYILLSYNNMAKKGNPRSNAKISDESIMRILSAKGAVSVYTQPHKAFSTGKSDIDDNEERIFLCKVK